MYWPGGLSCPQSAARIAPRAKSIRSVATWLERHPLAGPGEDDLVLADHVAAAQAGEADGALGPRAGDAVAAALGGVREVDPPPRRRRLAEHQRGARGRVDLGAVVHLDDLDVVLRPEDRATRRAITVRRFTPTLMLPARTITACRAAAASRSRSRPLQPGGADHMHQPRLRRELGVLRWSRRAW